MIHLKDVETIYEGDKTPIIKDIDLEIKKGEFVTIIGPNGVGKTTLLETINGLLESEGEVTVFGENVGKHGTEIRKNIGYIPQEFAWDSLTPFLVQDVVMMGRYGKIGLLRSPSRQDREIVEDTLDFLGITELAKKPIGKLSGGQLQKVMIARAIAQQPKILLLDEPFSNLDLDSRTEISQKIALLNQRGVVVIMVLHEIASIPPQCERILKMKDGTIVMDDDPKTVLGE